MHVGVRRVAALTLVALVISICVVALPAFAAGQPVSSTELLEHAREYDGQVVTYSGEAIGDLMTRADHTWVNVSDGANAISLWLTIDQARQIKTLGSYKAKGDSVTVTGTFRRACAEHGGDMDIHVDDLSVVMPGSSTPHPVSSQRIILAVLTFALAAAFFIADRRRGRQTMNASR